MKRIITTMMVLTALALGFSSCSKENAIEPNQSTNSGNKVSFTLNMGVDTRAKGTPEDDPTVTRTPALDREKKVSSLYAVVFDRSNGFFYKTVKIDLSGGTTAPFEFDMERSGDFDLYLVANPSTALADQLVAGPPTASIMDALLVDQDPGANNQATDFVMTSAKQEVTTVSSGTTDAGTIELQRLSARFDLFNRVEKLKITSITLKNRYVESNLNRGAANLDMGSLLFGEKSYTTVEGLDASGHECVATMYGYENMNKGATVLVLEGTYNNVEVRPYEVVLEKIPVKRNHLYSIVISPKGGEVEPGDPDDPFGDFQIEVIVNDWNEGAVIEWGNDQLLSKETPSFTVEGDYITTTPAATTEPAVNPTVVATTSNSHMRIEVIVTSSSVASILEGAGTLPVDYIITGGAPEIIDGQIVQKYHLDIPQNNTLDIQRLDFVVRNALVPSLKRTFTLEHRRRPGLPMEYVAEYNLADETSFANSHLNDASGYWARNDAVTNFNNVTIDGIGYHLPSKEEWDGIFSSGHAIYFDNDDDVILTTDDNVEVEGVKTNYYSHFTYQLGYTYGLRFHKTYTDWISGTPGKNDNLCAYLYEVVGSFAAGSNNSFVKVTCRYLGSSFQGWIRDIAKPEFWMTNKENDIVRIFPLSGFGYVNRTGIYYIGKVGYYWTATPNDTSSSHALIIRETELTGPTSIYPNLPNTMKTSIRLFKNRLGD